MPALEYSIHILKLGFSHFQFFFFLFLIFFLLCIKSGNFYFYKGLRVNQGADLIELGLNNFHIPTKK
jgi:hypothetical protein